MSESASTLPPARYDVIFTGETVPGRDPAAVHRGLQLLFRIDDAHAERLFSAGRVVVKRDVDLDTARRFRSAFVNAGALVVIEPSGSFERVGDSSPAGAAPAAPAPPPVGPAEPRAANPDDPFAADDAEIEETIIATAAVEPDPSPRLAPSPDAGQRRLGLGAVGEQLSVAPPGAPLDEIDDRVPIPFPDTSGLAIEPGDDWTLADCQLPIPAAILPPIDHLRLEPISPRPPRGAGDRPERPETANP